MAAPGKTVQVVHCDLIPCAPPDCVRGAGETCKPNSTLCRRRVYSLCARGEKGCRRGHALRDHLRHEVFDGGWVPCADSTPFFQVSVGMNSVQYSLRTVSSSRCPDQKHGYPRALPHEERNYPHSFAVSVFVLCLCLFVFSVDDRDDQVCQETRRRHTDCSCCVAHQVGRPLFFCLRFQPTRTHPASTSL